MISIETHGDYLHPIIPPVDVENPENTPAGKLIAVNDGGGSPMYIYLDGDSLTVHNGYQVDRVWFVGGREGGSTLHPLTSEETASIVWEDCGDGSAVIPEYGTPVPAGYQYFDFIRIDGIGYRQY